MIKGFWKKTFLCIGALASALLVIACSKDEARTTAIAELESPIVGKLYSSCFAEELFDRRGYSYYRDEFDFKKPNTLLLKRLWFHDRRCLGVATDLRERRGKVHVRLLDENGFVGHALTVTYDPPHFEKDAIQFSARIEDRTDEIVFHTYQELVFQNGTPAALETERPFVLKKEAPLW